MIDTIKDYIIPEKNGRAQIVIKYAVIWAALLMPTILDNKMLVTVLVAVLLGIVCLVECVMVKNIMEKHDYDLWIRIKSIFDERNLMDQLNTLDSYHGFNKITVDDCDRIEQLNNPAVNYFKNKTINSMFEELQSEIDKFTKLCGSWLMPGDPMSRCNFASEIKNELRNNYNTPGYSSEAWEAMKEINSRATAVQL